MNDNGAAWAVVCVLSVFVNLVLTCITLKLYTEFAKERFKDKP